MEKYPFGRGFVHVYQNYCFVQNKQAKDGTLRFKCRTPTCPVRINVPLGGEPAYGLSGFSHQDHDDTTIIEKLKTRTDAIEIGKTVNQVTGKRPALSEAYEIAVHQAKLRNLSKGYNAAEVDAMVPELTTIQTAIQNGRKKRFPDNPVSLTTLVVEHPFDCMDNGKQFLQSSNISGPQKMLVFATDDFLMKLAACTETWMDGTFYACPALFKQVYTIHALVNNQMYCLVYALLPGFSTDVYKEFFRFLQDQIYILGSQQPKELNFSPRRLTCDFEAAAISAARTVFPGVRVSGCHFHYCQCLWRNMQKKNLAQRYMTAHPVEIPLQRLFKRLCALSLIPTSEVPSAYETIVQEASEHYYEDQDVSMYFLYFETTWLNRIDEWNHYRNFGVRTNNHLEAFHCSLKKDLNGNAHPTLYPFIDLIRKRQEKFETKLERMLLGRRPVALRKQYVDANV